MIKESANYGISLLSHKGSSGKIYIILGISCEFRKLYTSLKDYNNEY